MLHGPWLGGGLASKFEIRANELCQDLQARDQPAHQLLGPYRVTGPLEA